MLTQVTSKQLATTFLSTDKNLFDQPDLLADYYDWRTAMCNEPLRKVGNTQIFGWNLDYVSAPALVAAIEYLVIYGLNNFTSAKESPLILDCGANIGISTLNYKRLFPKSRIIAFEPDPAFTPLLRRNLQLNGADDVEIIEAAVWTKNGSTQWICEGIDGSRVAELTTSATNAIAVKTIYLGDFLTEKIDLLKIDIESAEYQVIAAVKDKLHFVDNLIIECHLHSTNTAPLGQMLTILAEAGFQVGINYLSGWRDLLRQPEVNTATHFHQYLLVAAWRQPPLKIDNPIYIPFSGNPFGEEIGLRGREASLERRCAELNSQVAAHNEYVSGLQAAQQDAQKNLIETKILLSNSQTESQAIKHKLESTQALLQQIENTFGLTQEALVQVQAESQQLRQALNQSESAVQDFRKKIEILESELKISEISLAKTQADIDETQQKLTECRDHCRQTQNEHKKLQRELDETRNTLQSAQDALSFYSKSRIIQSIRKLIS